MSKFSVPLATLAALALSACGGDSASYMVDGKSDNAFSLFRGKSYPGADWEITLALTHLPDCQRRYTLKPVTSDKSYKAELFLDGEGDYALRSGKYWYQIRLSDCALKPMTEAPPNPGDPVGAWIENDAGFRFNPAVKS